MPAPYPISAEALAMLEQARAESASNAAQLDRIRDAALAANAGRTSHAADVLRDSLHICRDLRLLFLGFQFFFRTGDLDQAERITRLRIEIAESGSLHADLARACTNLGLILHTRARFDEARRFFERALTIDRILNNDHAIARDLGHLALVPESLGDLDAAEALYLEALHIARRIGADDLAATKLANLGDIAHARALPDRARELWTQALAIFERRDDQHLARQMRDKLRPTFPNPPDPP